MEYVDDTIGFNPEWIVDKISPRPILFITSEDDRLVLPEESEQLYAHAGEPKKTSSPKRLRPLRSLLRTRLQRGYGGDVGVVRRVSVAQLTPYAYRPIVRPILIRHKSLKTSFSCDIQIYPRS